MAPAIRLSIRDVGDVPCLPASHLVQAGLGSARVYPQRVRDSERDRSPGPDVRFGSRPYSASSTQPAGEDMTSKLKLADRLAFAALLLAAVAALPVSASETYS